VRALDALVVLAYVDGMCVSGVRMGRRKQSREEYFLAGRRMPWFFVGLSILATMLSTIRCLSLPGKIVKNGIAFLAVLFLATRLTWLAGIVFTSAYALAEITGVSIYLYL